MVNHTIVPARILKGFRLIAQGCEARATLGSLGHQPFTTPTGLRPYQFFVRCPTKSAVRLTLNYRKLYIRMTSTSNLDGMIG
jgi:hypothetical protein